MKKLSKQLHLTCVGCIQWGGKMWSGYEILHVLCRKDGVGTWVLLLYAMTRLTFWLRNYFLNFSTPYIKSVNKTGTKYVRIMKQTAF